MGVWNIPKAFFEIEIASQKCHKGSAKIDLISKRQVHTKPI